MDSQGRFVIPEALFKHAQLGENITFIGLINWIEIWDTEKWQKRVEYLQKHGDEIAQEISKMSKNNNG